MEKKSDHQTATHKVERGIYLLPNLMTTVALFAGFYAVIAGMQGHYEAGAIAIFIAMVFDGLDGRVARMTNTCTPFGAEYDSMSDMVSFGVAPALLVFVWALEDFGKVGWLVAFVFTAGAALRLARFNTQVGQADKRYFQGLPSPAAAALVAGTIWVMHDMDWVVIPTFALIVTLMAGLLMVSNVRYPSFKELNLKDKVPFMVLLVLVGVLVVIMFKPALTLFLVFLGYTLYGLLSTLWDLRRLRRKKHPAHTFNGEVTTPQTASSEPTTDKPENT